MENDRSDEQMVPGDEVPPETGHAAEDICPRCGGEGSVDGEQCSECEGTGRVVKAIGGG